MLNSGDVIEVDLGTPAGREAGFHRRAVVVTAQPILDGLPSVVQIVPLTSTIRKFASEVILDPNNGSGLDVSSAAQCQHVRSVATQRLSIAMGNVGPVSLQQMREVLAQIFDL